MKPEELIDSARDRMKMEREDRMGQSLAVAEIERLVNEFTQTVVSILEVLVLYGLVEETLPYGNPHWTDDPDEKW